MGHIRVLSEDIINRIAAGEVIENPASVVKELVENSLDAKSTQVRIELQGGGLQVLRVIDNGTGMSQDDAVLSLERHATSKIRSFEDLFALQSMGFRGEALAAIASVSKMTMTTSVENGMGTQIEIEGGKLCQVLPCSRKKGTTIEVRSLFYNVPARKKFQKAPSANTTEIHRLAMTFSLAYPQCSFELYHQDEPIFISDGHKEVSHLQALKNRIGKILGKEFLDSSYELDFSEDGYAVHGYIGDPQYTRHNRSGQYLFLDNRTVNSPLISYAVRNGYGTRIEEQRHPVFVLHLQFPKNLVDVNVHPQKKEVRFSEENLIKEKIEKAVKEALFQKGHTLISFPREPLEDFSFTSPSFHFPKSSYQLCSLSEKNSVLQEELSLPMKEIGVIALFGHYLFIDAATVAEQVRLLDKKSVKDSLIIVDLQAAFARVLYNDFLLKPEEKKLQALLFPISLSFSEEDMSLMDGHLSFFQDLGFFLHRSGKSSFLIEKVPPLLDEDAISSFINTIVDGLKEERGFSIQEERQRKLAKRASLQAKIYKKTFSRDDALLLFKQLLKTENFYHCPEGKPTMVGIDPNDIAEYFFQR